MTAAADDTVLEAVLRRDRQAVVAALIAVIAMAWLWILLGAGTAMSTMDMFLGPSADGMAGMMAPAVWTLGYAGVMFIMWWVMMAAMMLPSAAPILLLFARINRKDFQFQFASRRQRLFPGHSQRESTDRVRSRGNSNASIPALPRGLGSVPVPAIGKITLSRSRAAVPMPYRTCSGRQSLPRGQRIAGS